MREVRRDGDLSQKATGAERADEIRSKHLQRDETIMLAIARQVDGGHATAAELALDVVAIREGGAK